jgi:hypothetical protein
MMQIADEYGRKDQSQQDAVSAAPMDLAEIYSTSRRKENASK